MKIIEAHYNIGKINCDEILTNIEEAGRVCYKSESELSARSAAKFIAMIIERGHESVLEHEKITVHIVCDRGVSHEIVRHRIASYSQESTRYCNYSKNKFGNELTFIKPCFWTNDDFKYGIWESSLRVIEKNYMELIQRGASPQEARSILPNSLKTEIVVTMNIREWRHFFKLRASSKAHPQMQEIAKPLLKEMQSLLPPLFLDINPK